ncbi:MAG: hypothetical protein PVI74_11240, partial [Syntrophobacterales bacterium]
TPPLHHSSRLPQGGKTMEAPSGGSAKPGPLGPDSLLGSLSLVESLQEFHCAGKEKKWSIQKIN